MTNTPTPESRARQFIQSISDGWGEETEAQDAAALAKIIRQAENDALERAAKTAARISESREEDMGDEICDAIRDLKHKDLP